MHPKCTPKDVERFWSKVDRSGGPDACWPWTGGTDAGGYGLFRHQGRNKKAHRIAWELTRGPIPDGLLVCHNCPGGDNPACVNPAHLWCGTSADNSADMVAKGRQAAGDRNGSRVHPERRKRGDDHPARKASRLTWDDVRAIRAAHATGAVTSRSLAKQYGLSESGICLIVTGKNWREEHTATPT